jgi:hypothetical protein
MSAMITEFRRGSFTAEDGNGNRFDYDKGEGVECPTVIHADMLWPKGAEKSVIKYEGKNPPEEVVVMDGGFPLYHKYHLRVAA